MIAAEARFGTLATTGSYIPPRSPGRYRGAGVGPSPAYSYSAAVIEVEVDPETGLWNPRPRLDGPRRRPLAQSGAGDGPGRGGRLHGAGRGDDGGAGLPPAPQAPLAALVHKHPSVLEYKSPTFDDMPPVTTYLIEEPGPAGPLRRQGGRPGAAAAGDAGGGERHLRRRGRAGRPGADPSAHGAEGAGGEGARAASRASAPRGSRRSTSARTSTSPPPSRAATARPSTTTARSCAPACAPPRAR